MKKGVKTAAEAAECHRRGPAGLLHRGLCGRGPGRWAWDTEPWRHASARRDPVLRLLGRPRVLRRRRGRHRDRPQCQQGPEGAPAGHPQRSGQGCRRRSSPASTASPMCRPSSTTTTGEVNIVREIRYSEGERADVRCYGADDVREGVAIMHHGGRGHVHHGQFHQPHPVPASGGRHLQEGVHRAGQEVLLRGLWRRHRPYASPGQYGRRSRLLRHDRHHGPDALRRPVRRLLFRARPMWR